MAGGQERSGVGRFFGTFANAVLARTLPRIREFLEARLGPTATLAKLELDGPRVRLIDARIPLGARVSLVIDEAIFLTRPEELALGNAPVQLESLRGTLRATEGDEIVFNAPLELERRGGPSAAWVDADLTLHDASWRLRRGVGEAAPLEGKAHLRVTTDTWAVRDGALTSGASKLELDADGVTREGERGVRATLRAENARLGHFLDALIAWSGRDELGRFPMLWEGQIDGSLQTARGDTKADFTLRTEHSRLSLRLDAALDGAIERANLNGHVGWKDLPTELLVDDDASEPIKVALSASGETRSAELRASLRSEEVTPVSFLAPGPWQLDADREGGRWTLSAALSDAAHAVVELEQRGERLVGDGQGTVVVNTLTHHGERADGDPIELVLTVGGTVERPELSAEARSDAVRWRGLALRRLRARVESDGPKRKVRASARSEHGALSVRGEDGWLRLGASRLDAGATLAIVNALSDHVWIELPGHETARFHYPPDAEVWADVRIERRVLEGTVHVESASSRASFEPLRFDLAAGRFDGTKAYGTAGIADVCTVGIFTGDLSPLPEGSCDVVAEVSGPPRALSIRADLAAARSRWTYQRFARLGPLELTDAKASVEVDRERVALHSFSGRALGGRVDAELHYELGEGERGLDVRRLRVEGVDDSLLRWAGLPSIPGFKLWADARAEREALRGTIRAETAASDLVLSLPEGTLRGRVALAELPSPAVFDGAVAGELSFEGSVRWPDDPSLTLRVSAPRVLLESQGVAIELRELSADVHATPRLVEWRRGHAALLGGTMSSAGVCGLEGGLLGWAAEVGLRGVELGESAAVAPYLEGRLDARMFAYGALSEPVVRGRLQVEAPSYRGLNQLRELYSRWGLLPLPLASDRPLSAEVRYHHGVLEVEQLVATLDGARVDGRVRRSRTGRWGGMLFVVLERSWLETSHLLSLPARVVGDVTFPLHIEGRPRPRVRPDAVAAIDRWISGTRLGQTMQSAFDAIAPRTTVRPRRIAPLSLDSSDMLVDHIAKQPDQASEAVGLLLERGLRPAEIASRVAARSKRR